MFAQCHSFRGILQNQETCLNFCDFLSFATNLSEKVNTNLLSLISGEKDYTTKCTATTNLRSQRAQ